ncbi:MAG: 6-phospho-beta-glucosidase, partial [Clostridia bacterium]|nr:6-phospho-beta-glucosidase [Clostridia bacterium]
GEEGEMILCIQNQGIIEWLEDTDVIEVSCTISREGAKAKPGPYDLPESAKQLISAVKYYERTAAQAIVECDKEKAVDALMLHPLIESYSLAKEALAEYLEAYQEYTGGWGR